MSFTISFKRLAIIIFLLILEVIFLSLSLRSYSNKDVSENVINVMKEEELDFVNGNYKLSSQSGCISSDGKRYDNNLKYSEVEDKIVMNLDGSANCYFYFTKE